MKKTSKKEKKELIVVISAAVIIIIATHIMFGPVRVQTKPTRQASRAISLYLADRPASQWLLTGEQAEGDNFDLLIGLINKTTVKLENTLSVYSNISEVAILKEMFGGHFYVSFYVGQFGGTSRHLKKGEYTNDPFEGREFIEVVLYGFGHQHASRINDQFAKYDSEWRALILAGVELSRQWSDAVVIHELEHARVDRIGKTSSRAPFLSDQWIIEELQAHQLERAVLDQATGGRYVERLKQIVSARPEVTNLEQLQDSITIKDLRALDQLFESASAREAGMRVMQYFLDAGEIWLLRRFTEQEREPQRIINYRLVTSLGK